MRLERAMRRRLLAVLAGASVLQLAGCAFKFPEPVFTRTGRFNVRIKTDGGFETLPGRFRFERWPGDRRVLVLMNPMRMVLARITLLPGRAELEAGGEKSSSADAEALLASALGLELPVTTLAGWLEGAPVDAAALRGWRLSNEAKWPDGALRRLDAEHDDPPVKLRLFCDPIEHASQPL